MHNRGPLSIPAILSPHLIRLFSDRLSIMRDWALGATEDFSCSSHERWDEAYVVTSSYYYALDVLNT